MNIYDIAEQAGVSIATVSRVLNNKGTVSPATRAKVEAVLEKNNYAPSAIARGMVGMPMKKVAVLTVDIREPHYAQTAYTIEQEFSNRGYEVILCNTGSDKEQALRYLRAVTKKQVDGIILVGSVFNQIGIDPEVQKLLQRAPVVLANGRLSFKNSYSVEVDDVHGVYQLTEYLLSAGKKHLVYVKDLDTDSAKAKCNGFCKALERYGKIADDRVYNADYGLQGGMEAAAQLLKMGIKLDAIVCGEDLTAVGVVKGLQHAGVNVPDDVAVTGYNHSIYADICQPRLTTVDNQPEQVAINCVQLLERLMSGDDGCQSVTILPELIFGQST